MKQFSILFVALLVITKCEHAWADPPLKSFQTGSYASILQQHQGQAFVMVLWSLDCLPCHQELAMLGKFKQQHPDFKLVLIATDGPEAENEIRSLLGRYQLQQSSNWLFSEGMSARLRYEIDPAWYGVVPRSYLFDTRHQRETISGRLSHDHLKIWLRIQALEAK